MPLHSPAPPQTPARPQMLVPGRTYSWLDQLLTPADEALKTLFATSRSVRPSPAEAEPENLSIPAERRQVAGLMRVNHAGEIAAQALYRGHALVSHAEATRIAMLEAGREENDHLAWCAERIQELDGHTSVLNPLWYAGSFIIGAIAGLAGDRASLGFVGETERQVVAHLEGHLRRLPMQDARSRAILQQMRNDEERHGHDAMSAGGATLPAPVRALMQSTASVMTAIARWI
jgi:ubiquinone biosynthesis monooxygenase Coq7